MLVTKDFKSNECSVTCEPYGVLWGSSYNYGNVYNCGSADNYAYSATFADIKKVIFNPPYTIINWSDRTKTIVKCNENDVYNKAAGIALCVMKKIYGKNYHKVLKEWINANEK